MTQLTLGVSVAAFSDDDEKCPMEPHAKQNVIVGKAPEVKSVKELRKAMIAGQSTRQWKQDSNDSTKFTKGKNKDATEKPEPSFSKNPILIAEQTYPLSIAAHHLIPGKASLPKSVIKKYLWKKEGLVDGDVGYDVDGAENGKWLPTHQTMSSKLGKSQAIRIEDETNPTSTVGMSWAELSDRAKAKEGNAVTFTELFLPRYTQQAMDLMQAQFHDAHSDYNNFVIEELNTISTKIQTKSGMCEECKKNAIKSPPYLVTYQLNALSKYLDVTLSGKPKRSWKKTYTSEFSAMYARSPLADDKLGKY